MDSRKGWEWRVRRGPPRVSSRRTQEERSRCKRTSDESCRLFVMLFVMGTCLVRKTSSQKCLSVCQNPPTALVSDSANENLKLLDNLDDDEGYYRK